MTQFLWECDLAYLADIHVADGCEIVTLSKLFDAHQRVSDLIMLYTQDKGGTLGLIGWTLCISSTKSLPSCSRWRKSSWIVVIDVSIAQLLGSMAGVELPEGVTRHAIVRADRRRSSKYLEADYLNPNTEHDNSFPCSMRGNFPHTSCNLMRSATNPESLTKFP